MQAFSFLPHTKLSLEYDPRGWHFLDQGKCLCFGSVVEHTYPCRCNGILSDDVLLEMVHWRNSSAPVYRVLVTRFLLKSN
jgi:hypothetical protein